MALLQSAQFSLGTSGGGGTTTVSATLPNPVLPGSCLVVFVSWSTAVNPAATPSVADPTNGAYTQAGATLTDPAATQTLAAFYRANSGASVSLTVTLTLSAANRYASIWVEERSGADTTAPLDGTNGSVQSPGPNTTDGLTSGNFAAAGASGVVIGFSLDNFQGSPAAGTGFTNSGDAWDFNGAGGGARYARAEGKAYAAPGTYAATFTGATGNGSMTIGLALKDPGAPPVASPQVEFDSPAPQRRQPPRVDGMSPLRAVNLANALTRSPDPVRRSRAYVAPWEPLPGIPAAPALVRAGFSEAPPPRGSRRARVDGWAPLAGGVPGPPPIGWGFSTGTTSVTVQPAPTGWEPVAALQGAAANVPTGWECDVAPRRALKRINEGWSPLAALQVAAASGPLVDFSSPQPCRRVAPRPDAWEPIPSLAVAAGVSGGWECQPSPQRQPRATAPQGWEPIAPLLGPAVESSPAPAAKLRAIRPDGWAPLGAIATAPPLTVAGGFESEAPPVPLRRSPRVDAWEPLAAPLAPPTVPPLAFECSPVTRRKAARVDAWEPLPALLAPPPAVPAPFTDTPAARRSQARVEGWSPIPSLPAAAALGPLVSADVVRPQPRRQQMAPGGWEPIASLTDAVGDCFSPPPTQLRQRGAMTACWEPLPAIAVAPVPEEWGFSAQPNGRVRAARVDAWGVLGDLGSSPVAPMAQQFLLQAV